MTFDLRSLGYSNVAKTSLGLSNWKTVRNSALYCDWVIPTIYIRAGPLHIFTQGIIPIYFSIFVA